jgi:hypothetical protein
MTFAKPFALLLLFTAILIAQGPDHPQHGIPPRDAAASYSAHAGQDGFQIGASLLSQKEVKKIFSSTDLNQCCQVIEVAFYPPKNNFVKVSIDDFMLREAGKDIGVQPTTAEVLAAQLEVRPPAPDPEHKAGVSGESEIGYGRYQRRDPNKGTIQTRSGIHERESVSVGVPIGGKQQTPEQAAPGSRRAIQAELTQKGLPATNAWEPVAGYLYFPISKKPKDGFELVYTVNEKKIVLPLK